jgi:hypothetical protein
MLCPGGIYGFYARVFKIVQRSDNPDPYPLLKKLVKDILFQSLRELTPCPPCILLLRICT